MEPLKKIILVLDKNSDLYGKVIVFSFIEDRYFSSYYVGEEQVDNHTHHCLLYCSLERFDKRIKEGNWIEITEENKEKWEKLIPFI